MQDVSKKAGVHSPVLPEVVCDLAGQSFQAAERPIFVDGTLGEGGHTRLLLERYPQCCVMGLDRDPEMLARATGFCREAGLRVEPWEGAPLPVGELRTIRASFANAADILRDARVAPAFIVLDLGVSMFHFRGARRGFSYTDESLDMRLDPALPRTAADFINELPEPELAQTFRNLGEERFAQRIARAIVARRPIVDARALAALVLSAVPGGGRRGIHPATRVFQALRILVNDELGELERALAELPRLLAPGGILCVISFHSLEDRIVKRSFRAWSGRPLHGGPRERTDFELLTRRPIVPDEKETAENPAARSAKLRALRRHHVDIAGRGPGGADGEC